jgi:hypothetical protein
MEGAMLIKILASLFLSVCFCLPGWAERPVDSVDSDAIREEIRNALRDLQIQIPELLKAVRVKVRLPEIQLHLPEIRIELPEIRVPEIQLDGPVNVQIPPILIPEIRIEVPKIDVQTPKLPQ